MRKFDLEERLVAFVATVLDATKKLNKSEAGRHISDQMVRSSISVALNYAEAQSAESRRDFIHKVKISLKELRETTVGLKIVQRAGLSSDPSSIGLVLREGSELIAILGKSVETARLNMAKEKR